MTSPIAITLPPHSNFCTPSVLILNKSNEEQQIAVTFNSEPKKETDSEAVSRLLAVLLPDVHKTMSDIVKRQKANDLDFPKIDGFEGDELADKEPAAYFNTPPL